MGVERAVTRWYAQRQLLLDEITLLEAKIAVPSTLVNGADADSLETREETAAMLQQLASARERLHTLGPCPKPMMG